MTQEGSKEKKILESDTFEYQCNYKYLNININFTALKCNIHVTSSKTSLRAYNTLSRQP
jgi:hypothetical protein